MLPGMDPSVEVALAGMLAAAEDAIPVQAVEAATRNWARRCTPTASPS
jgi:hypothetical protein